MKKKIREFNDCPVCGASLLKNGNCKPKFQNCWDERLGNFYILCDNCGLKGPFGKDKQESIELWNRLKFTGKKLLRPVEEKL